VQKELFVPNRTLFYSLEGLVIIMRHFKYIQGVPASRITARRQVEEVILSQKVLYHFARFAIINEFLINKDPRTNVQPRVK